MHALPPRPVTRERVRQAVVDYVKGLVFGGELRIGDRVPQDDLASALGVSNTPVREAIIALEHEGIVRIEHHRGAFVRAFDAESIRDQYELFALLWSWAIRRAVEHNDPEFPIAIEEIARRLKKENTGAEVYELMKSFTDSVQSAGGSEAWRRLLEALPRLLPSSSYYDMVPRSRDVAREWMQEISAAIKAGDASAAVEAVNELMRAQGLVLVEELNRRGLI